MCDYRHTIFNFKYIKFFLRINQWTFCCQFIVRIWESIWVVLLLKKKDYDKTD